jgi:putative flippase GtrA
MTSDPGALEAVRKAEGQRAGSRFWLESVRYVVVGGFSFLVYFGLLGMLFTALRAPYPVAVGIAYVFAVAVHFLANRIFTFGAAEAPVAMQLGRYAWVILLNYGIQISVLYVMYDLLRVDFYLGAVTGVLATLVAGFLLMRGWVFARRAGIDRRALLLTPRRTGEPGSVGEK